MSAPGTNKVDFEVRDNVAIVTLDHFPVNTLTNAVQLGIEDAAEKIQTMKGLAGVIVQGAGDRAFCAGADIGDLNKKHERYPKRAFMEYFEELNIPVVALLQGFTLGGGFELALGCHFRIATEDSAVGLPEVNIGLLPGGQGTQRLPRLVGPKVALDIMLSGDHILSQKAKSFGLIDEIIPKNEDKLKFAIKFVKSQNKNELQTKRISQIKVKEEFKKDYEKVLDKFEKEMKNKRRNQPAPLAIIRCVKAAIETESFEDGKNVEQEEFFNVLMSNEAKSLQHAFFSERNSAKIKTKTKAKPKNIKSVGILGAGTMGSGIAMCFANSNISVFLLDREQKFIENGLKMIKTNYSRSVQRKSLTEEFVQKSLSLIKTTINFEDLKNCDLIVEAVFEDIELKKELFGKLDKIINKSCIFATNTSYLDIDKMSENLSQERRQLFVGMHFFSPANVMKLLENICGKFTNDETLLTVMEIGQKIGKWPVLVQNRNGFVGNRMLAFYTTEAQNMVLNFNTDFQKIDKIAMNFGMPMGPFMMNDLTGLDIGYQARKRKNLTDPKTNLLDAMIEIGGKLGMKNSKGFYDYEGRDRKSSDKTYEIISQVRKNLGKENVKTVLSDKEIEERLFFPIINEGFKVLEERVADKPSDIDTVYIHGYNWPRVTGGPMFYADLIGLPKVLTTLEKYYSESNNKSVYFKPAQLLQDCVKSKMSLEKFWTKFQENYKFKREETKL